MNLLKRIFSPRTNRAILAGVGMGVAQQFGVDVDLSFVKDGLTVADAGQALMVGLAIFYRAYPRWSPSEPLQPPRPPRGHKRHGPPPV